MVSGCDCKGPPCPLLHLACCPTALPKPGPQPSSPGEHRLLMPRDPLARGSVTQVGHCPRHVPREPSAQAAVVQLVTGQGAEPVCSVGSLCDPKPGLLS